MQEIKKQTAKGFTLIELLIVIAIIGLLATLAIVSLTGAQKKARDTKRIADAKQYQGAIELYYNQFGHYPQPASASGWAAFISDDTTTAGTTGGIGKYITQAPGSPNNNTTDFYTYAYNQTGVYVSGTGATEYVFMVKLEDVAANAAALAAGDDNNYSVDIGTTWLTATHQFIPSVTGATVDKNCAAGYVAPVAPSTTPTGTGLYCVSE